MNAILAYMVNKLAARMLILCFLKSKYMQETRQKGKVAWTGEERVILWKSSKGSFKTQSVMDRKFSNSFY